MSQKTIDYAKKRRYSYPMLPGLMNATSVFVKLLARQQVDQSLLGDDNAYMMLYAGLVFKWFDTYFDEVPGAATELGVTKETTRFAENKGEMLLEIAKQYFSPV